MHKIIITGRIPSLKNSKVISCRNGRPLVLPSKAYREWHEIASWELVAQKPPRGIEHCEIEIKFYAPDKRHTDLTNKAESLMDLLVDLEVIEDDNWEVVRKLTLEFMGKSDKPRAEITLNIAQ